MADSRRAGGSARALDLTEVDLAEDADPRAGEVGGFRADEPRATMSAVYPDMPAHVSVLCGTWNVGAWPSPPSRGQSCSRTCPARTPRPAGNKPPPADLEAWLPTSEVYDVIAIGTQECSFKIKKGGDVSA